MSNTVEEAIESLLECENEAFDDEQDDSTLVVTCLERIASHLHDDSTSDSTSNTTVRDALKGVDLPRLTRVLATLLADRVPTEDLMPRTYDDAANQAAVTENNAMTLTKCSFLAAFVYAQLVSMPGALGSGLVDLEALSALASLLRRWKVECCGREGKKISKTARISRDDDDDDDDMFTEVIPDTVLQPQELVPLGLRVATALSRSPLQTEFQSWSTDARESLVDAVTCALVTAAALARTTDAAQQVVSVATRAIQKCLVEVDSSAVAGDIDDDDDMDTSGNENLIKRHQTAIAIMRGIYPTLIMKDVVPNGENGKTAAATAASLALEGLVQEIANDFAVQKTPTTTPAKSKNPTTPLSSARRRRRSSIRGSTLKRKQVSTPAKLKGAKTPRKALTPGGAPVTKARPILTAIVGLLQKIATDSALEKVAVRHPSVETICRSVQHLPRAERSIYLDFLRQLCHSKVSLHRLVGSELVGRFLSEEWLWSEHGHEQIGPAKASGNDESPDSVVLPGDTKTLPEALFLVQLSRLQDRVPTIRAATSNSLAGLFRIYAQNVQARPHDASILGLRGILEQEGDDVMEKLRRRTMDEKATVRRSAVETLVELLVQGQIPEATDMTLLQQLCADESVTVRRASADALTRWMECADPVIGKELEKTWCNSVLSLILDCETTCVSKGVELVERIILIPILSDRESQRSWRILDHIARGGDANRQADALRKALTQLAAPSTNSNVTMKSLLIKINGVCISTLDDSAVEDLFHSEIESQRNGAWCLFDALMSFSPNKNDVARAVKKSRIDLNFIATSWEAMLNLSLKATGGSKLSLLGSIEKSLHVLSKLATCVDSSLAMESSVKLLKLLKEFYFSPELIGPVIEAVAATTVASADSVEIARMQCSQQIREVYATCHASISTRAGFEISDSDVSELVRALFSVGELSLVGFSPSDDEKDNKKENQGTSDDPLRGLHERPSSVLVDIVGAFLPHFVPGSEETKTPESLRAHAFIAIGKLCLRDEKLAKKSLNIFARELYDNMQQGSWKVQSNALLVMGDLCVRYTNMVDRYLPVMAACMQAGVTDLSGDLLRSRTCNGAAHVRKHAVYLLSNLLLQDYIKWRGLLFHRFLVASADEDDEVARFAANLLCGQLVLKHPKLFANQFVESLFVLNRCTAHHIYVAAASTGDGGSGISVGFDGINLTGEVGRVRRMQMYQLMLSRMSDAEKISVTARITKEVLGSALETGSDLNRVCITSGESAPQDPSYASAATVLSDALAVLADPLMRVGKSSAASAKEDPVEDLNTSTANPAQKIQAAQGKLLSNISRKHLVENILPVLCNLKVVLQKSRSSLLKNLQHFLVYVFRQFRAEVTDFLANDRDLLQEIEYDARLFHKAMQQRNSAKKATPLASEFTVSPVSLLDGFN